MRQAFDANNLDDLHLYIDMEDCEEDRILNFHRHLVTTGERFRGAVDDLIAERQALSDLAIAFREGTTPKSKKFTNLPAVWAERKNNFFQKNRIEIEAKINNLHFRVESLRLNLLRMFDEIFARRMGRGYAIQNPGRPFLVYIQHTPIVRRYIEPEKGLNRPNRSVKDSYNCVTEIDNIMQLPKITNKESNLTIQIFSFKENEIKLKEQIEELTDLFGIWSRTSLFFYSNHWLAYYYKDIVQIYETFKLDFLTNPRAMKISDKQKIISDFRSLIKNQFKNDQNWYYYGGNSLDTLKHFMMSFYKGIYPHPPPFQQNRFHDELK